jgi:hypothetical protein
VRFDFDRSENLLQLTQPVSTTFLFSSHLATPLLLPARSVVSSAQTPNIFLHTTSLLLAMFAVVERGTSRTPWDFTHSRSGYGNNGVSGE